MSKRSLPREQSKSLLLSIGGDPCKTCDWAEDCREKLLACSAFIEFVKTGNKTVFVESWFLEPNNALYEKVFSDQI